MLVLALETSSSVASVAIGNEEKLLGEITINDKNTHSEKLMPIINQLLKNLSLSVKDIDLIAVSVGPGSFTGLRIGISAAKGLAHPHKIPLLPVSSLISMSYNLYGVGGYICPIFDARRNQVYTNISKWNDEKLEIITPDQGMMINDLIEKLKNLGEKVTFLGDGVYKHRELIEKELGNMARFANVVDNMQKASSIVMMSLEESSENYKNYDEIEANYLRKSEAEQNYENKQESK